MLRHLHAMTGNDLECVTRGNFVLLFFLCQQCMYVCVWGVKTIAFPGTCCSPLLEFWVRSISSTFLPIEKALLDVRLPIPLLKKPIATRSWSQTCLRRWLVFGWWQYFEWVINLKFSEPSETLKWPQEQGRRLLGLPRRIPGRNFAYSGSPQCQTWTALLWTLRVGGKGGAFQFPRASPTEEWGHRTVGSI